MTIFEYCHNVLNNNYRYIATEEANEETNIFIGKISLTLPIVINVPPRTSLASETKGLLFL